MEGLLQRRVELVTPEALSHYIGPKILKEAEYVAPWESSYVRQSTLQLAVFSGRGRMGGGSRREEGRG